MTVRAGSLALALVGALSLPGVSPGSAQATAAKPERTAIEECVASAVARAGALDPSARTADERRACVFLTTESCEGLTEADCYDRERAVWDERLNRAYRTLRTKAPKPLSDRILATQRSWVAYRDAMCERFFTKDAGSMAVPASRACLLKETAWRALVLDDMLADITRTSN
jgi:uncharacterized protein YecT (DUF1311 family)